MKRKRCFPFSNLCELNNKIRKGQTNIFSSLFLIMEKKGHKLNNTNCCNEFYQTLKMEPYFYPAITSLIRLAWLILIERKRFFKICSKYDFLLSMIKCPSETITINMIIKVQFVLLFTTYFNWLAWESCNKNDNKWCSYISLDHFTDGGTDFPEVIWYHYSFIWHGIL